MSDSLLDTNNVTYDATLSVMCENESASLRASIIFRVGSGRQGGFSVSFSRDTSARRINFDGKFTLPRSRANCAGSKECHLNAIV